MKYLKSYQKFKDSKPVNEEIIGGLVNLLKGMWGKATEEIKKIGKNPSTDDLEKWIDQNPLNPKDDSYLFKAVVDEFNKKTEANEQDCLDFIKNILDPQTGCLGKQGLQTLYDNLLKAFGKDLPTLDIIKFYLETIRNRAIKDYKYAGGPDLKVGTDAKVDDKKIINDMKDTTHLPEYKKAIAAAAEDNKKRKQIALDWLNKTLVPRLDKYLSEIKDEDVEKYLKSINKEMPTGGGDFKEGDAVFYKRDNWEKNKGEEEWSKLTDDDKKKPTEGKIKDMIDKETIGIKVVDKISGDEVSFKDAKFKKNKEDVLGKAEGYKVEGQVDLVDTLKDVKGKNPEAIKQLGKIAKLYQDPASNKDKISKIEAEIGDEDEGE